MHVEAAGKHQMEVLLFQQLQPWPVSVAALAKMQPAAGLSTFQKRHHDQSERVGKPHAVHEGVSCTKN